VEVTLERQLFISCEKQTKKRQSLLFLSSCSFSLVWLEWISSPVDLLICFRSCLQESPNERPSENCGEERRKPTEFPRQLRKKLNTKYFAVLLPLVRPPLQTVELEVEDEQEFSLFVLFISLRPSFSTSTPLGSPTRDQAPHLRPPIADSVSPSLLTSTVRSLPAPTEFSSAIFGSVVSCSVSNLKQPSCFLLLLSYAPPSSPPPLPPPAAPSSPPQTFLPLLCTS